MKSLSFVDAKPPLLVCIGESTLTHPLGGPTWPDQFGAANPGWSIHNLGHDGRQTQDIDYDAIVRPLINPCNAKQVMVLQTGANDLINGHSVALICANIATLVVKAFNDGIWPLVCTCMVDGFVDDAKRLALNVALRILYPDNLIDFAAPWFHFSTSADAANTVLFSDTAHPTAYGATGLMTIAAPSILGAPNTCPSVVASLRSNVITLLPVEGFALVQQCDQ